MSSYWIWRCTRLFNVWPKSTIGWDVETIYILQSEMEKMKNSWNAHEFKISNPNNFWYFFRHVLPKSTIGGNGILDPILEWEMYRCKIRKERPNWTRWRNFFWTPKRLRTKYLVLIVLWIFLPIFDQSSFVTPSICLGRAHNLKFDFTNHRTAWYVAVNQE